MASSFLRGLRTRLATVSNRCELFAFFESCAAKALASCQLTHRTGCRSS